MVSAEGTKTARAANERRLDQLDMQNKTICAEDEGDRHAELPPGVPGTRYLEAVHFVLVPGSTDIVCSRYRHFSSFPSL